MLLKINKFLMHSLLLSSELGLGNTLLFPSILFRLGFKNSVCLLLAKKTAMAMEEQLRTTELRSMRVRRGALSIAITAPKVHATYTPRDTTRQGWFGLNLEPP